jgi:hypothetical protein
VSCEVYGTQSELSDLFHLHPELEDAALEAVLVELGQVSQCVRCPTCTYVHYENFYIYDEKFLCI